MTSAQKLQNLADLKPPSHRSEIPIYLNALVYPGVLAGISQKEITQSPDRWLQAVSVFFDKIGKTDANMATYPGDVIFLMGLEARRPGIELGDNDLYQFIETPKMDHDDYRDIAKNGWMQWYNRYLCTIQAPPLTSPEQVGQLWMQVGMNAGKVAGFLAQNGVEPVNHTAMGPVFDTLSMIRSFEEFCYDLVDEPGLVQDALRRGTPEMIESTLGNLKFSGGTRAGMFAMRSDANSISPEIFDEFVFPYLRQTVEAFHSAGVTTNIHADGNWLPMLDRLLQLPKGSVCLQFDGVTDIYAAYDVIGGHLAMCGDVPATMLAFGTYDEVRQYCENLVTKLGMKGGFMLANGCEVPMNAKPENIKAIFDAVRT